MASTIVSRFCLLVVSHIGVLIMYCLDTDSVTACLDIYRVLTW